MALEPLCVWWSEHSVHKVLRPRTKHRVNSWRIELSQLQTRFSSYKWCSLAPTVANGALGLIVWISVMPASYVAYLFRFPIHCEISCTQLPSSNFQQVCQDLAVPFCACNISHPWRKQAGRGGVLLEAVKLWPCPPCQRAACAAGPPWTWHG